MTPQAKRDPIDWSSTPTITITRPTCCRCGATNFEVVMTDKATRKCICKTCGLAQRFFLDSAPRAGERQ